MDNPKTAIQDEETTSQQSDDSNNDKNEETEEQVDYETLYKQAEKRRRDTQAAYTRGQQALKKLQKEKEVLEKKLEELATRSITQDAKLEELKYADPDAWRAEVSKLEKEEKSRLLGELKELEAKASREAELQHRAELLAQYNTEHPDNPITDEVIENDIPPRIVRKLEKGEVSFEEFLDEVSNYLKTPKKIAAGDKPPKSKNLGKAAGDSAAAPNIIGKDIITSYEKEVY